MENEISSSEESNADNEEILSDGEIPSSSSFEEDENNEQNKNDQLSDGEILEDEFLQNEPSTSRGSLVSIYF